MSPRKHRQPKPHRRTKIVCTIGPATSSPAAIRRLARAGMDVARLNFSYGTREEHAQTIARLRSTARDLGRPIGILQDLSGPKLRVGALPRGEMRLRARDRVVLSAAPHPREGRIPLPLRALPAALSRGDRLLLADGRIELTVLDTTPPEVCCEVRVGGLLRSHQGLNVPDAALPIRTVTSKDLADLRFGLEHQVDWVAMSFVRSAKDLDPLRRAMKPYQRPARLIAKIEKREGVDHLEEILEATDGLMVARGDLGIELPLAQVPLLQKSIISACNRAGKPVITATQMLDSMVSSPRPTRAEVSDVANAVFDGTDAVMLSGETAVGRYPAEAVRVMGQVVTRTESALDFEARLAETTSWPCTAVTDGIGQATCTLAEDIRADAIITATSSGYTAFKIAMYRPRAPIVAVTDNVATLSRLALAWGVRPLLAPRGRNTDELILNAVETARRAGLVRVGDRVVVTAGVPTGPGNTNLIKVEIAGRHHAL